MNSRRRPLHQIRRSRLSFRIRLRPRSEHQHRQLVRGDQRITRELRLPSSCRKSLPVHGKQPERHATSRTHDPWRWQDCFGSRYRAGFWCLW
jgi:hypothetical protein